MKKAYYENYFNKTVAEDKEFRVNSVYKDSCNRRETSYCKGVFQKRFVNFFMEYHTEGCRGDVKGERPYFLIPGSMPVEAYRFKIVRSYLSDMKEKVDECKKYGSTNCTEVLMTVAGDWDKIFLKSYKEVLTNGGVVTEFVYSRDIDGEPRCLYLDAEGNIMRKEGEYFFSEDGKDIFFTVHKKRGMK